jgi:hypothetical protein
MAHNVKIPGTPGKIEARALRMHNAVVAELARVTEAKRPNPKPAPKRTFAHIRDWRDGGESGVIP